MHRVEAAAQLNGKLKGTHKNYLGIIELTNVCVLLFLKMISV
jgi:hypothetical protein